MHVLEKWRKFYVSTFYDYSMVEIFQLLSHYLQFIEFCRSRSATRAIFMRIYNNNFHGSLAAIFYILIVLNIMFPPIYMRSGLSKSIYTENEDGQFNSFPIQSTWITLFFYLDAEDERLIFQVINLFPIKKYFVVE